MVDSKVDGIIKTIYEDRIEEFYFKISVPDGYRLKLIKDSNIVANVYVTEAEVNELLAKLHIKTESIVHNVFKLDLEKEAYVRRIINYVHELGVINATITSVNATEEELIQALSYLKTITKDNELAEFNVNGVQKEELYNVIHRKHLEYLDKYSNFLLTEAIS